MEDFFDKPTRKITASPMSQVAREMQIWHIWKPEWYEDLAAYETLHSTGAAFNNI